MFRTFTLVTAPVSFKKPYVWSWKTGIIQEMGHQIWELYFSVIKRSSPKHHSNKAKNSSKNTFWEVSECSRLFSPVFPTDIHDVLQKTVDFLDLVHWGENNDEGGFLLGKLCAGCLFVWNSLFFVQKPRSEVENRKQCTRKWLLSRKTPNQTFEICYTISWIIPSTRTVLNDRSLILSGVSIVEILNQIQGGTA